MNNSSIDITIKNCLKYLVENSIKNENKELEIAVEEGILLSIGYENILKFLNKKGYINRFSVPEAGIYVVLTKKGKVFYNRHIVNNDEPIYGPVILSRTPQ